MARPKKNEIRNRDPEPKTRDPKQVAKVIRMTKRRCHICGGEDFETHDSHQNAAGVRSQHCTCRACGAKQIFVFT